VKKLVLIIIALFIWHVFQGKSVNATIGSGTTSELSPTNLNSADFIGVSLDGVILCNTTMPDRTINNSSCKN
jgi:hypothetical protein